MHTYRVPRIIRETRFNIISHAHTHRVNTNSKIKRRMLTVAMPLFVNMYFRLKLDVNVNFTMQNDEWVFISAFFQLSPHLTPKDLSLFICSYITLSECATPVQRIENVQLSLTRRLNTMYQNK